MACVRDVCVSGWGRTLCAWMSGAALWRPFSPSAFGKFQELDSGYVLAQHEPLLTEPYRWPLGTVFSSPLRINVKLLIVEGSP